MNTMSLDCLFINVGRRRQGAWDTLAMPMGTIALAALLNEHGVSAKLINLPFALFRKPSFSIADLIIKKRVKLVCLPLFWHYQADAVLALAADLKKRLPGLKIVVGGMTASIFSEEVMRLCPAIDFLIRGDAEEPLLKLAPLALSGGTGGLQAVPNLLWRKDGRVIRNPHTYTATARILDSLDYSKLDLIINWRDCCRDITSLEPGAEPGKAAPLAYYSPGRGCPSDCAACGGGRNAQWLTNRRKGCVVKSERAALEDLRGFAGRGIKLIQFFYGPALREDYLLGLFALVRRHKLRFSVILDCCVLPSQRLLDAFHRTFGPDSRVLIWPESGAERLRRKNRKPFFSNEDLLRAMEFARSRGIRTNLVFTTGLASETKKDLLVTAGFIRTLKARFDANIRVATRPIAPASPMYLHPARFSVRSRAKSFSYYLGSRGNYRLGYAGRNFKEAEIVRNAYLLNHLANPDGREAFDPET
jgi:radical SAM superfamily enzyme YgiQ (UPF0313 family)